VKTFVSGNHFLIRGFCNADLFGTAALTFMTVTSCRFNEERVAVSAKISWDCSYLINIPWASEDRMANSCAMCCFSSKIVLCLSRFNVMIWNVELVRACTIIIKVYLSQFASSRPRMYRKRYCMSAPSRSAIRNDVDITQDSIVMFAFCRFNSVYIYPHATE